MAIYLKDKIKTIKKSQYQLEILSRIVTLRKENGYSQEMVAHLLGVTNGQVGNSESEFQPHKYTLAHIYKICKHFQHPIQKIFLGNINTHGTNQLIDAIVRYEEGK